LGSDRGVPINKIPDFVFAIPRPPTYNRKFEMTSNVQFPVAAQPLAGKVAALPGAFWTCCAVAIRPASTAKAASAAALGIIRFDCAQANMV